jgi:aldehyde:ferredoxin oxidoreductase
MKGRIARVDLSRRSYTVEELDAGVLRRYIGGRGLGSYLLCQVVKPLVDPLSAENHLLFLAGLGSGTGLLFANKAVVVTKSPLTGAYLYSVSSGMFAHHLRKAGFWAMDIFGISEEPVYLALVNQTLEFCDAASLWGMEVVQAQNMMAADLGRGKAATVAIGTAGEKKLLYAAIMADGKTYRAFGRGGAGAVMGSKQLKGIVVSGDGVVEPVDMAGFLAVNKQIVQNVKANAKWVEYRRRYGTGGDNLETNKLGIIPTRNWQGGQFEGVASICPSTNAHKWPRSNISCAPYCPAPCSHYIEIKEGHYSGAHCDGPEYETMYSFGYTCGVDSFDAVVAANQICDEYGLDTISAGVTIGFAMECFERGLIGLKDTEGIELRFGNAQAMIAALMKLARYDGFGRKLALGVKRLSLDIPGSEGFAMHVKGMELGGYECRGLMGQALQFAVNPLGGSHHAFGLPGRQEAFDGTRMEVEGKGEYVREAAIGRILRDSLGVCTFPTMIITTEMVPEIMSALTGESWVFEDVRAVGMQVMCQERFFNMREGLGRTDDSLPNRLLREPKPDGPTAGVTVPIEELKDDFYRAMGWDQVSGNPPNDLLDKLGIDGRR